MGKQIPEGNREFAATNQHFRAACELAGIQPTKRQASKWKQGRGLAFSRRAEAGKKLQPVLTTASEYA